MGAPLPIREDAVVSRGRASLTALGDVIVRLRERADHRRAERLSLLHRDLARELSAYRDEVGV